MSSSSGTLRWKCCICGTVPSSGERLFKVPKLQERLKKWMQLLNREDLLERGHSYLQNNAKVCTKHFSDWAFVGTDKKRLIAFALPGTAEPPYAPLPQMLQSAAIAPSVQVAEQSQLQVAVSSDTSLSHVTKPSNVLLIQAAPTVSSIRSGHQVDATKFVAPSISSQSQVAVLSVSPQPQVSIPSARSHASTFAASSTSPCPQDMPINPPVAPFKRSREAQIILNQRSTISRLRKKIEKLKVSFSQQLKNKLSPDMYSFVMSQIRQGGRSNKGRRWEKEDKTFALAVYKKSPSVYKLLRAKLAFPHKSTLKRFC